MVRPATDTAVRASISTPVFPIREASAVIFTEDSSMFGSIPLSYVKVDLEPNIEESCVNITAEASLVGKTGVEMEALTAVSVASLTIYDMCKAIDKEMILTNIKLIHKSGGKSGEFNAV